MTINEAVIKVRETGEAFTAAAARYEELVKQIGKLQEEANAALARTKEAIQKFESAKYQLGMTITDHPVISMSRWGDWERTSKEIYPPR
jgi:uncharacterized coiled-coil DUF342 family protein